VVGTASGLAAVTSGAFAANAYPAYLLAANTLVLGTLLPAKVHVRTGRREGADVLA
jgi:hypothetical protein